MIIDCISDLHGHLPILEGGDLLIVAGDFNAKETPVAYLYFYGWMKEQKYKKIILVPGNHDTLIQEETDGSDTEEGENFEWLIDRGTEFEGLKIWGSPWTKKFEGQNPHCMAFTVNTDEELGDKMESIPHDVDILVTHSPPFTILDKTIEGYQVGSTYLMASLIYRFRPKLWVFGHIHESYGQDTFKETVCVNASHVNKRYEPVNKPIRIVL